jgi:DNA (cytosine-5)-methyltransferase 1
VAGGSDRRSRLAASAAPAAVGAAPARRAPIAAEFFAGIGLVRLGLESAGFDVRWSNDIEPAKQQMYEANFGEPSGPAQPAGSDRTPDSGPLPGSAHSFDSRDVGEVAGGDLPAGLSLAWASFPCTDLSLAGWRRGLDGSSSSTFWQFCRILAELGDARPPVIALENVVGLATSRGGADLAAAIGALNGLGYVVDVLVLDARRFVPQSRPRLFIVGWLDSAPGSAFGAALPREPDPPAIGASELRPPWLQWVFADARLRTRRARLPPPPPLLRAGLGRTVEAMPDDDPRWWDEERAAAFIESLSPLQRRRVDELAGRRSVAHRTAYRRTRGGRPVWEVRPDDIAGCLRTARGGSSRQAIVRLGRGARRVRWMTPLEYARLMGAPRYRIDGLRANQALFGFGDAVCVPAVGWLARHCLMPLLTGEAASEVWPSPLETGAAAS